MHSNRVCISYIKTFRLGKQCRFEEENELAVAIKYVHGQGQLIFMYIGHSSILCIHFYRYFNAF